MTEVDDSRTVPAGPKQIPLEAFVGEWLTEGRIRETGQLMRASDTYERAPGGFFLLHRWDARFPESRTQGIEVIGHDPETGGYFMRSYDSDGNVGEMHATLGDGTWEFASSGLRFTGGFSHDGCEFSGLWEQRVSPSDAWNAWMDITLTRVG